MSTEIDIITDQLKQLGFKDFDASEKQRYLISGEMNMSVFLKDGESKLNQEGMCVIKIGEYQVVYRGVIPEPGIFKMVFGYIMPKKHKNAKFFRWLMENM